MTTKDKITALFYVYIIMNLTEKTYKIFDQAKIVIPSLEIRFHDDKCHLYVKGKAKHWAQGSASHVNSFISGLCLGIVLNSKYKSLKITLNNL